MSCTTQNNKQRQKSQTEIALKNKNKEINNVTKIDNVLVSYLNNFCTLAGSRICMNSAEWFWF